MLTSLKTGDTIILRSRSKKIVESVKVVDSRPNLYEVHFTSILFDSKLYFSKQCEWYFESGKVFLAHKSSDIIAYIPKK